MKARSLLLAPFILLLASCGAGSVPPPLDQLVPEAPVSSDDTGQIDIGTAMQEIRGDDGCVWTFESVRGAPSNVTTSCAAGSTQPADPFFP